MHSVVTFSLCYDEQGHQVLQSQPSMMTAAIMTVMIDGYDH